ncbi:hypothetical protein GCM10025859_43820 [Alicyclobacillus fastidiosus]|nr:hypothetical protein GCM10025859_43820 [Alicyclobacillus fastidiosus]
MQEVNEYYLLLSNNNLARNGFGVKTPFDIGEGNTATRVGRGVDGDGM